jgi:hypothetical protein
MESFPGAKITHMRHLLTKLEHHPSKEPKWVIISIGINDRENNVISTSLPNLRKMAAKANQIFPLAVVAIPEINIPDHLSDRVKHNIKQLNDSLHEMPNVLVIPQIDPKLFTTTFNDIHWTQNTANKLLTHWLTHLNG